MKNTEDTLLRLRFVGAELESKSVPIYELGQTLISVQRIVNKSYLFKDKRLESGGQLTDDEQLGLSLQIGTREKGSDIYGLIPFLTDPMAVELVKTALAESIKAISAYASKKAEI